VAHAPGLRAAGGARAFDAVHVSLLAVALLHERVRGTEAYWASYVRLLPQTQQLDVPALWSAAKLARLAGSPVAVAAAARAGAARSAHAALLPALCAADPAAFPAAACGIDAFAWAHATVLARAFDVPSLGLMALAPGLDLCNHGSGCTLELSGGAEASRVATCVARAGAPPPALLLRAGASGADEGAQVLHAYAGATAGEALLEFGFVHAPSEAAHAAGMPPPPPPSLVTLDASPLLAQTPPGVASPGARLAALHGAGLCAPLRRFELSSVGIAGLAWSGAGTADGDAVATHANADADVGELMLPPSLLHSARALVATPAELAAASERGGFARPLSAAAEARALAALEDVVSAAQNAYPGPCVAPPPRSTGAHAARAAATRADVDERRARLAATVVHGERRVLQAAAAALRRRAARVAAGDCMS
jgi:hypothetical protein